MDFSAPNPQPTGLPLADTRTLETQTDNQISNKDAIDSLRDEEDSDIFAWLKLARSLPLNSQCTSNLPCLTRAQLRAICILRFWNPDEVSALLRRVRSSGPIQTSTVPASHFMHHQAPNQELGGPSIMANANSMSLAVTPPSGGAHQLNLPRSPAAQPSPAATVPPVNKKHQIKYYCTYCDNSKCFVVKDNWRMHEREHLSLNYVCRLNGITENTAQGIACAFCRELDPSEDHLLMHNASSCGTGLLGSFWCNRREEMCEHLFEAHNVKESGTLKRTADRFKDMARKRTWSCGFCLDTFADFEHRLNHIASHFEHGQTMDDWDTAKLIKGLLQQPELINAWETKVPSQPTGEMGLRYWRKHAIKALRRDLEVGPTFRKTAFDLVNAAFDASKVDVPGWDEWIVDLEDLEDPNSSTGSALPGPA